MFTDWQQRALDVASGEGLDRRTARKMERDEEREALVRELEAAIAAGDKEREARARQALKDYDAYRSI